MRCFYSTHGVRRARYELAAQTKWEIPEKNTNGSQAQASEMTKRDFSQRWIMETAIQKGTKNDAQRASKRKEPVLHRHSVFISSYSAVLIFSILQVNKSCLLVLSSTAKCAGTCTSETWLSGSSSMLSLYQVISVTDLWISVSKRKR